MAHVRRLYTQMYSAIFGCDTIVGMFMCNPSRAGHRLRTTHSIEDGIRVAQMSHLQSEMSLLRLSSEKWTLLYMHTT